MTTQAPRQIRDAWETIADRFDRYTTPQTITFGERVLSGLDLGPGVSVLDVAAGSGGLSIPAARTGADVVAVDFSPTMIERLLQRAQTEGLTTLSARVGDGQRLDVNDASFDVALSMNGVSLFPDLAGGLREMVRVTRPGGRVMVVTFGPLPRAEFIAFFLGALRATAPEAIPPPNGPMPPFRLADPATFREALVSVGLRDVRIDTATWDMHVDSADHLLDVVLASNPIAGQLAAGLSDSQLRQARQVLDGMLRERSGGPGADLQAEMRIGLGIV